MAGELVSFNTRQLSDIYRQRNCFALIISKELGVILVWHIGQS